MMDVSQSYCGDDFAIYTYIKLLCYTPETNRLLYFNYVSIPNQTKFWYKH